MGFHPAQPGSRAGQGRAEQSGAGQGVTGQHCGPSKGMCVHPKCKSLQDLKSAVAALVLNGVLGLARGDAEVLGIVYHAC